MDPPSLKTNWKGGPFDITEGKIRFGIVVWAKDDAPVDARAYQR
jgi:hypothetical protein